MEVLFFFEGGACTWIRFYKTHGWLFFRLRTSYSCENLLLRFANDEMMSFVCISYLICVLQHSCNTRADQLRKRTFQIDRSPATFDGICIVRGRCFLAGEFQLVLRIL